MARAYDITVFGATGFTGRQTAAYLAAHAPSELRLCIAGRSRDKLDALTRTLGRKVGVAVADSSEPSTIAAMVRDTRVIATTAGPYERYGTPVVDACVEHQTHYCDITGETQWVASLVSRYHQRARSNGTRIVPFCGYDSCPSDLGAFLIARQRGAAVGAVAALHRSRGGINGGTVATALLAAEAGRVAEMKPERMGVERLRGHWCAPFLMGAINTWTVRRSAELLGYGPGFSYREYWWARTPLEARITNAIIRTALVVLPYRPARALLARLAPKPGEGPSEAAMDRGWFKTLVLDDASKVEVEIRGQGDPGNRATIRFLAEAALALALDELPSSGGVLTPASAFGAVLVERMKRVGFTFDVRGREPERGIKAMNEVNRG